MWPLVSGRRGNVRLRTAIYLHVLNSLHYNPQQITFYTRLQVGHSNGKPGVIAVMRKLLLLYYSLWKNDQPYDPRYHLAHQPQKEIASAM
jgi:transposase